jgi:small conductance mechanosensitive channel
MIRFIHKYLLTTLLSITFILTFTPHLSAQIAFFSSPENNDLPTTPSWDLNKAYPCGKYWCSNVFLFGNSQFFQEELTLALPRQADKTTQEVAIDLEQRAKFVQNIYQGILNNIVESPNFTLSSTSHPLSFWLINHNKPLHPSTPLIEVGTENEQTVVYHPSQLELGLSQQAIVTVTEIDAKANATTMEKLAEKWRNKIKKSLSDALWGIEMDKQYPFLRLKILVLLVFTALIFILVVNYLEKFLKKWKKNLSNELNNIKDILTINPEAQAHENLEGKKQNSPNVGINNFNNSSPPINQEKTAQQLETLDWIGSVIYRIFEKSWKNSKQVIVDGIAFSSKILPTNYLQKQNILKQEINLAQLILRIIFLSKFTVIFLAIGTIVTAYRETRYLSSLFFTQALLVPIIWIVMILADKIVDFWIDYSLNKWARERQSIVPHSNRPTLRVNTYSPAFQGATTLLFTTIGLLLTFKILGINPNVLAGAGVLAVVFAFISRNLLEDILNGILLLATDRYAVGDVVQINGLAGCVEQMSVYSTSLRDLDGQLITIPNGEVSTVINMTKNWSQVNFTIKIAWQANLAKTLQILQTVAEQMYQEVEWQERILQPAEILGIEEVSHEGILIRLLIKTKPSEHWNVGREYRLRVKQALDEAGITPGIPQREIWHHHSPYHNSGDDQAVFVN